MRRGVIQKGIFDDKGGRGYQTTHPFIQMTVDFPSAHTAGWMPILNVHVRVRKNNTVDFKTLQGVHGLSLDNPQQLGHAGEDQESDPGTGRNHHAEEPPPLPPPRP